MDRCSLRCVFVVLLIVMVLVPKAFAENSKDKLYVFAVQQERAKGLIYDENVYAVTLQGIVNRECPNLYILWYAVDPGYRDVDLEWLRIMSSEGNWLSNYEIVHVKSFIDLVRLAEEEWGVGRAIIWDTDVDATVNVATTLAGIYDAPVASPQLAEKLNLEAVLDLRDAIDYEQYYDGSFFVDNYFGNNRVAYQWLLDNYGDQVSKDLLGFCLDGYGRRHQSWAVDLGQRDLFVAEKAVAFCLSMWETTDPEDKAMIDRILETLGGKVEVIGFVPWQSKYGNENWYPLWSEYDKWRDWNPPGAKAPATYEHNLNYYHRASWSEWELVSVLSAHSSYLNPVHWGIWAGNITVHRHYTPDETVFVQPPPPTKKELIEKGYLKPNGQLESKMYITFIMGDMDNYGWIRQYMRPSQYWADEFRQVHYSWDINPSTLAEIPDILEYLYKTRNETDHFISSQSGIGYMFPNRLPDKDALAWYKSANLELFQKLDLKATFVFDRERPRDEVLVTMADIAPDGFYYVIDNSPFPTTRPENGLYPDSTGRLIAPVFTVIRGGGLHDQNITAKTSALRIASDSPKYSTKGLGFAVYSLVSNKFRNKEFFRELEDELDNFGGKYAIVDHRTFAYLYRLSQGKSNDNRSTFTSVAVPEQVNSGDEIQVELEIRNDGWNDWNTDYIVSAGIVDGEDVKTIASGNLDGKVPPASKVSVELELDFAGIEQGEHTIKFWVTPPPTKKRGLFGFFGKEELIPFPERDSYFCKLTVKP